jgi:predicted nicotinamide N-methyase
MASLGATIEHVGDPRWSALKINGGSPMYDATENQQSTRVAPPAARGTFTAFGARHVKGVAVSRWIATASFVIAGLLVVAFGHWWGLVFFVAAALNGSLAYLVPHWNPRQNASNDAKRSA